MADLIARLKGAEGPSRELDEEIRVAVGADKVLGSVGDGLCATADDYEAPAYTASWDAAMTLVRPAYQVELTDWRSGAKVRIGGTMAFGEAEAKTAPLALCIAALAGEKE